jgi:BirA family transcriptional regulator, biotin operon repressor / biotin---[acetyl-CoA-carboxylase] ligase
MMQLDPRASAAGVRLVSHELLVSTNTEALTLARAGERGPLWVTAGRQSAGRGRRGRSWVSEPGNLFASLLLTDPAPPEHWSELSFVAALAIHDAVADLAPSVRPQLAIKWPNDLLLAEAKFAGTLTEAEGSGAVVVGIGINCTSHPADTEYSATDLAAAGVAVSAEAAFSKLSAKMIGRLAQWNQGEHFATIRTDWLSRAAGVGGNISVRLPERELAGVFETVDEAGRLLLVEGDGSRHAIAVADVVQLGWPRQSDSRGDGQREG